MFTPRRIQLKRTKGWRKPENTVVVTRPGKWGNPFKVEGKIKSVEQSVELFKKMMNDPSSLTVPQAILQKCITIRESVSELKGKNLACWCKVGSPCHGDVLLQMANNITSYRIADGEDAGTSPKSRK